MKTLSTTRSELSLDGRWLAWLTCLIVSTLVLIGPSLTALVRTGIDSGDNPQLDEQLFLASKAFHVTDYALLAGLTAWLRAPRRVRALLLVLLSMHALGTEFVQQYVEGRTGSLRDVGLDHFGMALGLAATWKWWLVPERLSETGQARPAAPLPGTGPGGSEARRTSPRPPRTAEC